MKAANFEAQTPDGRMQVLYDVKSPYIALFFYHYDCDHCIETAPKLAQQYPALKLLGTGGRRGSHGYAGEGMEELHPQQ